MPVVCLSAGVQSDPPLNEMHSLGRIGTPEEVAEEDTYRAALRWMLQVSGTPMVRPEPDAPKHYQQRHNGLAAYDAWGEHLLRDEGWPAGDEAILRVSSMLEVTVREVERAGEVLDGVVAAGANQVCGVSFTVSDDQKWQSEAREKAMADARSRAEELARLAGVELGDVLSVSEVIGGGVMMAHAERAMGGGGGIAPGELEMSTQVQATFAIR